MHTDISVLRVIGGLEPASGGPTEVTVNACIASQRCGIRNTLVFAGGVSDGRSTARLEDRLRSEGVTVKRFATLPVGDFYARRWGVSLPLCRWLMRNAGRFDVVHIHQTWGLAQLTAMIAALAWRRPFCLTPHESLTNYDVNREKRFAKSLLKRWYLASAARVELASALELGDSIPPNRRAKCVLLPHPLLTLDPVSLEPRPPTDDAPLTVGFLGRLHPKKNVDVLLRALALVGDGARLRVAGEGPEPLRQRLVACANDSGLSARVEWLGFITQSDRPAFFQSIDVLVLPSEYESFGVAAAEAMAYGVPVIVSSRTGVAEMVSKYGCGVVVEPTARSVAAALERFANDGALATRLGLQGPIAVQQEMSMAAYGARARANYHLIARTPTPWSKPS